MFYHSKSSSDLKRSPKRSSKGASDLKLSQKGPRTPPVQWWSDFLEAKRAQKGAVLRLKIVPKIVLDSGAEKVVHLDATRLANRTLGTSKVKETLRMGLQISAFHTFQSEGYL